jgi:hypothetical protein
MLTALLTLLTLILLLVTARARLPSWRVAFLVAAVLWGLAVAIFTEVLSLWHALNFWGVAVVDGAERPARVVGLAKSGGARQAESRHGRPT